MTKDAKAIIGTNTYVRVDGVSQPVVAKVDTGADGSSLWASGIRIGENDRLYFTYFDPTSSLYDGKEHHRDVYKVVKVTSSTGDTQIRFQIKQRLTIGNKTIVAWCSLTDRSRRTYPMLIGKRTLKGRFIVDVSISEIKIQHKKGPSYHEQFLEKPDVLLDQYRHERLKDS